MCVEGGEVDGQCWKVYGYEAGELKQNVEKMSNWHV